MSLSTQRIASLALVGLSGAGLAWSELSGSPAGPASASAATAIAEDAAGDVPNDADHEGESEDAWRVAFAQQLRSYAAANEIDAADISDPCVLPASWQAAPAEPEAPIAQQASGAVARGSELVMTAVMDTPEGPVARVNGVLLFRGKPVELPGAGRVELIEVGTDRRSALVRTPAGDVRVRLSTVIGAPGA